MSDPGVKGSLHPALRPANVHATLKLLYQREAVMQSLFRLQNEDLDEYRDIADKEIVGNVGEISAAGGFPLITAQFESIIGTINGYGGKFNIGFAEGKWSKVNLSMYTMDKLVTAMKLYYELKVMVAIRDISGASTFNGTDWTDTTTGDPWHDLQKARSKIRGATGQKADTLVVNETYFLYMMKFKEFREFLYTGIAAQLMKGDIAETITPNGLRVIVVPDDFNTYIRDAYAYVTKVGNMGVNHSCVPFTSLNREDPDNPWAQRYFAMEWQKPAIDKVDAKFTCVITGLDG